MKLFRKNWLSRLFDNDVFVRILSVIIAVIGWFLVTTIVDPSAVVKISNVPIKISLDNTNAQLLGLEVVEGGDQTVNISVKGKGYQLGSLTAENFEATLRTATVTGPGTYELEVAVSKRETLDNPDFQIISANPSKVTVRFDRIISKDFALKDSTLEVQAEGVQAADGYIKGTPTVSPETITITGPETDVKQVSKAVISTSVKEYRSESLTTDGKFELYDAEGKVIDQSKSKLKFSADKFTITVPILKETTLPLIFDYLNVPDGFDTSVLKFSIDNPSLEVAAAAKVLEGRTDLNIGYVDFRKLDLNATFNFAINLPSTIKNLNNIETATVKFDMSDYTSTSVRLQGKNIRIINKPESIQATVKTSYISAVKIIGNPDDIKTLSAGDVIGEIDLLEQKFSGSGSYDVPVRVLIPSKTGVWAYGEYTAVLSVTVAS